jgi:hypothetical protein
MYNKKEKKRKRHKRKKGNAEEIRWKEKDRSSTDKQDI